MRLLLNQILQKPTKPHLFFRILTVMLLKMRLNASMKTQNVTQKSKMGQFGQKEQPNGASHGKFA